MQEHQIRELLQEVRNDRELELRRSGNLVNDHVSHLYKMEDRYLDMLIALEIHKQG